MDLFLAAGTGRENNDSANKSRERILASLYNSVDVVLQDLRVKWRTFLQSLCASPYADVSVKIKGGRGANYDFEITFLSSNNTAVQVTRAEFKHNATAIDTLPEYFSPAADKPYLPRSYAEVFYDEYVDRICDVYSGLSDHKPDRTTYVRFVYNNKYDRHSFFRTLYDMETNGTRDQYKQKQVIVRESIQRYLEKYAKDLDVTRLTEDIRDRQRGKVFVLWTLREFVTDTLSEDELEITHVERIKNGNTIVAVSKAGTKHNMLLRWKNHLGILYPAWQISLTR
jgi:hypothetical protein